MHVIAPSADCSLILPTICSCCCHRTAVAYNPEHCAPEISANMFPTMSIASNVRNPLGEIPRYRRDRTDIDKPHRKAQHCFSARCEKDSSSRGEKRARCCP